MSSKSSQAAIVPRRTTTAAPHSADRAPPGLALHPRSRKMLQQQGRRSRGNPSSSIVNAVVVMALSNESRRQRITFPVNSKTAFRVNLTSQPGITPLSYLQITRDAFISSALFARTGEICMIRCIRQSTCVRCRAGFSVALLTAITASPDRCLTSRSSSFPTT